MLPRLVMAGLSGESGKTLVSLALLLEAKERGIATRAFKKGPDYIDAAWLGWASGHAARNLDTYLMGFAGAAGSFARHALAGGLNLIEGNRGLFDGVDARGTHSTAELAKAIDAPVVLVINATKVTRTVAALVLGCQRLDPSLRIAGVVLNHVCGARHERVLRESIETVCRVPVLGAIPRAAGTVLQTRHLGLVTPEEHPGEDGIAASVLGLTRGRLDLDQMLEIARRAPEGLWWGGPPGPRGSPWTRSAHVVPASHRPTRASAADPGVCPTKEIDQTVEDLAAEIQPVPVADMGSVPFPSQPVTVGYLRDSAFTFYYPENLEALVDAGAELAPISSRAGSLPDGLDALYIGGGFPETHAEGLSANEGFLASIREAARRGLPIYAECGGLMLLSRGIRWHGCRHAMAGVLPFDVEVCASHQGHGYVELLVDRPNPFFAVGARIKGHEFHYSRVVPDGAEPDTACAVLRGTGCFAGRDAVIAGNVWASYTHVHAVATPEWAAGFLRAIRRLPLPAFPLENDLPGRQSLPG